MVTPVPWVIPATFDEFQAQVTTDAQQFFQNLLATATNINTGNQALNDTNQHISEL
jgi:hypothetical protein